MIYNTDKININLIYLLQFYVINFKRENDFSDNKCDYYIDLTSDKKEIIYNDLKFYDMLLKSENFIDKVLNLGSSLSFFFLIFVIRKKEEKKKRKR